MSDVTNSVVLPQAQLGRGRAALLLAAFVTTSLLSALLLFLVQPLMARFMLPLLGGSPSVWAVTMCFFQAALLLGYSYAHVLNRFVPLQAGIILHGALMLIAIAVLPVEISEETVTPFLGLSQSLALLCVLATTIGLPFAVMSANAPLIQSWFSVSGHKDASEPYFLYGASNLGSIAALLIYPTLIEPAIGLHDQAGIWARGFMWLAVALLTCGALVAGRSTMRAAAVDVSASNISWATWTYWLAMAFLPSALLVAWTNHLTTDMATAPFLWLPPLILYLVSFIAVFRGTPWFSQKSLRLAQLAALPFTFVLIDGTHYLLMVPIMLVGAITFFATACLCHRQMFETRPQAGQLTAFYLTMSLGGVLGGLFVSLLAPVLFHDVSEYPLLLMLAVFLSTDVMNDIKIRSNLKKPLLICVVGLGVAAVAHMLGVMLARPAWTGVHASAIGFYAAAVVLFIRAERKFLMGIFIFLLIVRAGLPEDPLVSQARNFFGVLSVKQSGEYSTMYHGTTVHGAEFMADLALPDGKRPHPLTYYAPNGGMAQAIASTKLRLKDDPRVKTFGIVGLGAGSLVCYAEPGEKWKTFEINPDVVAAARDPKLFNFLDRCGKDVPVVVGDARLTLRDEAAASYDVLVIDAFSSDSIPVHLITTEAMQLYLKLLRPDGLLVFHVSNRHMELDSIVSANLAVLQVGEGKIHARHVIHLPKGESIADTSSEVVIMSRSAEAIAAVDSNPEATQLAAAPLGVRAWTDDYSNILGAIVRNLID
jgi:SAM-dependent methyltransferase